MLKLEYTSVFKRDVKRAVRRGLDMSLLDLVISALLSEQTLPPRNKDHALSGDYINFRECHIQPDWLLIYRKDASRLILVAQRTGTHADLFGE